MSPRINRIQKLRQKLVELEADGMFVSQPENRYYLSGFTGSAGFLLITPGDTVLATDFRYTEQARIQAPDYRIFQITGDMAEWLPGLLAELNCSRLGFEAEDITFATYQRFTDIFSKANLQPRLVSSSRLVESLRAIKEPEEIKLITEAIEITDDAFQYVETVFQDGITEKDLAWKIERFLRERGGEAIPFDIIVGSGPNAALPHARPSTRTIGAGEPVVIDIGAKCGGYSSDMTRTFCAGRPGDKLIKVYDTALRAQQAAINSIKAGMTGEQADSLARTIIKQAGYDEAFGHALGHGIGLATHEQPRLGPKSSEQLIDGMVFTIEPGIYLIGWGGVRIEDDVVMESGKVRVISKARRNLV